MPIRQGGLDGEDQRCPWIVAYGPVALGTDRVVDPIEVVGASACFLKGPIDRTALHVQVRRAFL